MATKRSGGRPDLSVKDFIDFMYRTVGTALALIITRPLIGSSYLFPQFTVDITLAYRELLIYSSGSVITDERLERFIYALIPTQRALYDIPAALRPFYAYTAVRRMLFFLNGPLSKQAEVRRLVHSEVMGEYFSLHRLMLDAGDLIQE